MTKCRFRILPCPVVFVSNAVAKFITPPSSHGNRLLQRFVARTLCFRLGQQLRRTDAISNAAITDSCFGSGSGSHAYLMRRRQIWPLHVAGISSIFCFWVTSSSCCRHMQSLTQLRCRLRLGSQDSCMKSLPCMRVRVCVYVCVRERKRFALKPLCGDAKTSSQVKNYCHSVKWSHLTLGALTRRCYSEKDI